MVMENFLLGDKVPFHRSGHKCIIKFKLVILKPILGAIVERTFEKHCTVGNKCSR